MTVEALAIEDVKLIVPRRFKDSRGFFCETWNQRRFNTEVSPQNFVQDNFSSSKQGTLRGLHYQVVKPQGKLVSVTYGEVFDVAVDLRRSSATFGRWVGEILSAENGKQLWIPVGFAHGFVALTDHVHFSYKCTDVYAPDGERTIRWDDPDLAIDWPIDGRPRISEKDQAGSSFVDADVFE